jgi:uncharacterized repeat protein (TIGR03803 family)
MKKAFYILMIGLYLGIYPAKAQYSKLLDFDLTNGAMPLMGSPTLDGNIIYVVTSWGGINSMGCIFKINTDGTGYTKLFDFSNAVNCASPCGSLVLSGDVLYGTTITGGTYSGGCVFKINTNGSGFARLHDFNAAIDGSAPYGSLILSGTVLYGTTRFGATGNAGTVFKMNTDGSGYSTLMEFGCVGNGSEPCGALLLSGDVLYGTTLYGGTYDQGTIFSIDTNGDWYQLLFEFDGGTNGSSPIGSLTLSGNVLYGTTVAGGGYDEGCLFSYDIDGDTYTPLLDFNMNKGSEPTGSLILADNMLYGTTASGGFYDRGCIFQFDPVSISYTKLLEFEGMENGGSPQGGLTFSGSAFYGTTIIGGINNFGVVFKYAITPASQTSNIDFPFVGTNVADISWINGNGEKRVVFMKVGSGTITYPDNNTTYNASSDWNTKGSQLGSSGYYCVYNGPGNVVSITNLIPVTTYTVQAFEYNGNEGSEQYLLDAGTGNPMTFQTESVDAIQTDREDLVRIYSDGCDIYAGIDGYHQKTRIEVYNLSGVCIASANTLVTWQNKISGNYKPGIYIVRLVLDDKLFTQKIIIR